MACLSFIVSFFLTWMPVTFFSLFERDSQKRLWAVNGSCPFWMLLKILPYLSISRGQLKNQNTEVSNLADVLLRFLAFLPRRKILNYLKTYNLNSLTFCLQFSTLLCTDHCSSMRLLQTLGNCIAQYSFIRLADVFCTVLSYLLALRQTKLALVQLRRRWCV